MADDQLVGQWGTISYKPPDKIAKLTKPVNDVSQVIVQVLQVAIDALEIAQAYNSGALNPLAIAAKELVTLVEGLAKDLGRVGLYVSGDWPLMKMPFKDVRGGYAEWERRMIGRLTDRTDQTRPVASAQIEVVSLFLYMGVDVEGLHRLAKFLDTILNVFSISVLPPPVLPTPVLKPPLYGLAGGGRKAIADALLTLSAGPGTINVVQLRWTVASLAGTNPVVSLPAPPPGGFLICVSTVPQGIRLVMDRPIDNQGKVAGVQVREHGDVRDEAGRTITLWGGFDQLALPDGGKLGWNDAMSDTGKVKDGFARVYGLIGSAEDKPIPLDQLVQGDQHLFQRSFIVKGLSSVLAWASGTWTFEIEAKDLPCDADVVVDPVTGKVTLVPGPVPSTFHVRVAALTAGAAAVSPRYDLKALQGEILGRRPAVARFTGGPDIDVGPADIGAWSRNLTLAMPGLSLANLRQFMDALETALAVLVLCRIDLPILDDLALTKDIRKAVQDGTASYPDIAALATGLEGLKPVLEQLWPDMALDLAASRDPAQFRSILHAKVRRVANDVMQAMGQMPVLQDRVIQGTKNLRLATWKDILVADVDRFGDMAPTFKELTILGSVLSNDLDNGIAASIHGMGVDEGAVLTLFQTDWAIQGRSPQFLEAKPSDVGFKATVTVPASEVKDFLAKCPPGLRSLYLKSLQPKDGSIKVNPGLADLASVMSTELRTVGSGDKTPIIYAGRSEFQNWTPPVEADDVADRVAVIYTRTALAGYKEGVLLKEAALALGAAAAAIGRPVGDGAWLNIRLKDAIPIIDDLMQVLLSWVKAVQAAIKSVEDVVSDYIEFLKARIADLQQMIQRINALVQMLNGLLNSLPKVSGLLLVSKGTDGVVADLVAAQNKPTDGPRAYAAGIAVVMVTPVPAFVLDLFKPVAGEPPAQAPLGSILGPDKIPPPDPVSDDQPL